MKRCECKELCGVTRLTDDVMSCQIRFSQRLVYEGLGIRQFHYGCSFTKPLLTNKDVDLEEHSLAGGIKRHSRRLCLFLLQASYIYIKQKGHYICIRQGQGQGQGGSWLEDGIAIQVNLAIVRCINLNNLFTIAEFSL